MLLWVYIQSPLLLALILALGILLWPLVGLILDRRLRKPVLWPGLNAALGLLCLLIIFHATILARNGGVYEPVWRPFASFVIARTQPERYRSMLMNVYLFIPLGMTLSAAMGRRFPVWAVLLMTTAFGLFWSAALEWMQYVWQVGILEVDDALCNTLGTLLGACQCLFIPLWRRLLPKP